MISKEKTTELLGRLVAIASPYFQEEEVMEMVRDWFCSQGIPAVFHEYHEAKVTGFHGKNVVVTLEGSGKGPVVHLNGHLDTVKICSGWNKNPYGQQEGEKFYGVGALDMKAGCAAVMMAVSEFYKQHESFAGAIKASFVSVEEGPYGMGTDALIESGYLNDVDVSIVTEPSSGFQGEPFPTITLGARGGYGLEIEFFGKSTHAATPESGVSAAEDAAAVICELKSIAFPADDCLGKGTCCVIAMEADGGACSVPDYSKVKIFWHIVRGENEKTITRDIEAAVQRANIKGRYAIKFREAPSEDSRGFLPYTTPLDDKMVIGFARAVKRICRKDPEYSYFKGIGDFNYLGTRLPAPAIVFGPSGENCHAQDEYVDLDSVHKTALILYDFLEELLIREI
jgi:acetylornithine deacetylase/succinyl-diaminopimelate desuccinylase-like protein